MRLTESLEDYIEFKGQFLKLDLSFDVVLKLFELEQDNSFNDYEKLEIIIEMFVIDDILPLEVEEMLFIYKSIMEVISPQNKQSETKQEDSEDEQVKERLFDFTHDADFIYSSFIYDYKIDLIDQQGILHWRKFYALFNSLSDDCQMGKVINIRGMELPKGKEHEEERRRIRRLKKIYELPLSQEERDAIMKAKVKSFDEKLSGFAQRLKRK